jgi:hypothetical protein
MRDYLCIGVLPDNEQVAVMDCAHVKQWIYNEQTRKMTYGSFRGAPCLTVGAKNNIFTAQVQECRDNDLDQQWIFTKFNAAGKWKTFAKFSFDQNMM